MNYENMLKTINKENFDIDKVIEYVSNIKKEYEIKEEKLNIEIEKEQEKTRRACNMRDHIFQDLQEKERQFNDKCDEMDKFSSEMNDKISQYKENEKSLNKHIRVLKLKGERYDNIEKDLSMIHKKAVMDAQILISDSKEEAMESIFVIDRIKKSLKEYKSNLLNTQKKINDKNIFNVIEILLKQVNDLVDKLDSIKIRFYKDNNIDEM